MISGRMAKSRQKPVTRDFSAGACNFSQLLRPRRHSSGKDLEEFCSRSLALGKRARKKDAEVVDRAHKFGFEKRGTSRRDRGRIESWWETKWLPASRNPAFAPLVHPQYHRFERKIPRPQQYRQPMLAPVSKG